MVARNGKHMQTLGLFGDSFVQDHRAGEFLFYRLLNIRDDAILNTYRKQYEKAVPAWWELLDGYNATSHGVGGADNYCGLVNFLTNHEKYERIIFLITEAQRQSFWFEDKKSKDNLTSDIEHSANCETRWIHATNRDQCIAQDINLNIKQNKLIKKSYDVMKSYHENLTLVDRVKGNLYTDLIIEKVKALRPDTLFIDGFEGETCYTDQFFNRKKGTPLIKLYKIDNEKLGERKHHEIDMRISHQTTPSNKRLAKIIKKHLDSKKTLLEFDTEPFKNLQVDKTITYMDRYDTSSFKKHLSLLGIDS